MHGWVIGIVLLALPGCSERSAQEAWSALRGVWQKVMPGAQSSPGATGSPAEKFAQGNSEILQEVYRVVWLQEPSDLSEFGSWVDALNQGASIEGVYNGFTHSDRYRALEQSQRGAAVKALKAFAVELARLTREMPEPTRFEARAAQPLPVPVEPEFAVEGATRSEGVAPPPKRTGLEEEYARVFVGSSVYTLKRVLGDQALLLIHQKENDRERLADWYSKWVAEMAGSRVDFGLKLRNDPALSLHYGWAMATSTDRIVWEVLNRLHRVINAAN